MGSRTAESDLRELLEEAAEAAKDEHGKASAIAWAGGYTFPPEYMASDIQCLRAAQLDYKVMVRRRLKQLSPGRLNAERVSDNPEIVLMRDLAEVMRVHLPEGFTTNGPLKRSARRPIYETVSTTVNKMLGGIVEQKLAFLLPLEMALQHVPNLHLCKAHWTTKKGKVGLWGT